MLTKTMQAALNKQINAEAYSSYLYLSMAAWCETKNLKGSAQWMKAQQEEEWFHVMKFFDFVNDRSGEVKLGAVDAPPTQWESVLDLFTAALEHEKKVSAMINDLVVLARQENDFATENFLQWFVAEQVEEEASVDEIVNKLNLAGAEGAGLFMIDQELGTRTFTPPAQGE
jgi:ferritin